MANKAFIEVVNKVGEDTFQIVGVFTDEVSFKKAFNITINGLRSLEDVRLRLASALEIVVVQKDLIIPIGEFDLTPPVVDPPIIDEKRAAWEILRVKLIRAQILSVDNSIRINLQEQVDNLALEEYF